MSKDKRKAKARRDAILAGISYNRWTRDFRRVFTTSPRRTKDIKRLMREGLLRFGRDPPIAAVRRRAETASVRRYTYME